VLSGPGASWSPSRGEALITARGEACFYCGEPVRDPAIEWSGTAGQIWLHPPCALDFVVRLTRDIHEYQCVYHAEVRRLLAPPVNPHLNFLLSGPAGGQVRPLTASGPDTVASRG
jgi:hypothetical protein